MKVRVGVKSKEKMGNGVKSYQLIHVFIRSSCSIAYEGKYGTR